MQGGEKKMMYLSTPVPLHLHNLWSYFPVHGDANKIIFKSVFVSEQIDLQLVYNWCNEYFYYVCYWSPTLPQSKPGLIHVITFVMKKKHTHTPQNQK